MVERVSGYDGVELVVGEHEAATAPAIQHLDDMLARRAAGEPLQYVLGRWDFLGLDLMVDRRVLVPRPETEVVARPRSTRSCGSARAGARTIRGAARRRRSRSPTWARARARSRWRWRVSSPTPRCGPPT